MRASRNEETRLLAKLSNAIIKSILIEPNRKRLNKTTIIFSSSKIQLKMKLKKNKSER